MSMLLPLKLTGNGRNGADARTAAIAASSAAGEPDGFFKRMPKSWPCLPTVKRATTRLLLSEEGGFQLRLMRRCNSETVERCG